MFLHYHTKHMRGLLNVAHALARFNINEWKKDPNVVQLIERQLNFAFVEQIIELSLDFSTRFSQPCVACCVRWVPPQARNLISVHCILLHCKKVTGRRREVSVRWVPPSPKSIEPARMAKKTMKMDYRQSAITCRMLNADSHVQ